MNQDMTKDEVRVLRAQLMTQIFVGTNVTRSMLNSPEEELGRIYNLVNDIMSRSGIVLPRDGVK